MYHVQVCPTQVKREGEVVYEFVHVGLAAEELYILVVDVPVWPSQV